MTQKTAGATCPQAAAMPWRRWARAVAGLALAAALVACGGTGEVARPRTMDITVLGFNDLHGNLAPPTWTTLLPPLSLGSRWVRHAHTSDQAG